MLGRLLIAILGALVLTAGLLLAMDAATGLFRERDLQRYFRITDILPKPAPGRPERPGEVTRFPDTPAASALPAPGSTLPIERALETPPTLDRIEQPGVQEPRIDAEAGSSEAGSSETGN